MPTNRSKAWAGKLIQLKTTAEKTSPNSQLATISRSIVSHNKRRIESRNSKQLYKMMQPDRGAKRQ